MASSPLRGLARWWRGSIQVRVVVTTLALPVTFVLLPITLRRAQVRPAHIARIWLYSLIGPGVSMMMWTAAYATARGLELRWLRRALNPWIWDLDIGLPRRLNGGVVVILLIGVWMWAWWTCAARQYLRLERTRSAVALLSIIAILVGFIVEAT